ncbi:hypothetical protein EDL96_09070 [Kocuria soli]|uniref:GerMN domain-containing protein n=1 Tax=Kocuria soli TaxID=2485125 RepID=A0A3N4A2L0_9MICC|nr:LpqB family beta-propeller domain-containing protein [Kocuria soli]ROZ62619.1 hypothetical protein EDL96_09070 [Kocuria soli]
MRRTHRFSLHRWPLAVTVTGALLLSGCASIPTSGPVHQADPPVSSTPDASTEPAVAGPEADMTPEEVVQGFLAAGQGQDDDYAVARQYLTTDLAETWSPYERTVVFSGAAGIQEGLEENQVRVSVDERATIDDHGVMKRREAGSSEEMDVELTEVDGQWRISSVPDGVLVPASNLDDLYQPHNLYFLGKDGKTVVPDPRWFPDRQGVSTSIIRALLNGPAPYLEGSVDSAFPEGTELAGPSVPVQDGTAEVSLDVPDYSAVDVVGNRNMYSQVSLTLLALGNVENVNLSAGGGEADLGADDQSPLSPDPVTVPSRQIGLDGDRLVYLQGGQTQAVDSVSDALVGQAPQNPAMNADMTEFAALVDDGSTLVTFTDAEPEAVERFTGEDLSAPSMDPNGWVWVGTGDGQVRAADSGTAGTQAEDVDAPWLDGRAVRSLKISRDGSRALIVVSDGESAQVLISGVQRDDDGRPQSLNTPYLVDSGEGDLMMGDAAWISETQFVATSVTDGGTAPRLYDISGRYRELPYVDDGVTNVAGGNGEREIFVESGDELRLLTGESWSPQSDQIASTAFAG